MFKVLKKKNRRPRILYLLNGPSEGGRRKSGRQNEVEEAFLAAWLWAEVVGTWGCFMVLFSLLRD